MKICVCCQKEKEEKCFCKNRNTKDKLHIYCRFCQKIHRKKFKEENPERWEAISLKRNMSIWMKRHPPGWELQAQVKKSIKFLTARGYRVEKIS